jgi:zinc D-Ala-D-Ala carboxypeptidase
VKLSPNFTLQELTQTSTGLENIPGPVELARLQALAHGLLEPVRAILGVPLRITSAYRSPGVNLAVRGSSSSAHLTGDAVDLVPVGIPVESAMRAIYEAHRAGQLPTLDQAIVYPSGNFLHLGHPRGAAKARGDLLRSSAPSGSGGPYSTWRP